MFDPNDPFGEGPGKPPPMEEEIERHLSEFAALGMNAHSTVAMWLGKPNRFTGSVMTSALEVLEYVRTELDQTKQIQAEVKAAAKYKPSADAPAQALQAGTSGDEPVAGSVVTAGTTADPGARAAKQAHKDRVNLANLEWREAIRKRNEAMAQWDIYVASKRDAFQKLKMMKV